MDNASNALFIVDTIVLIKPVNASKIIDSTLETGSVNLTVELIKSLSMENVNAFMDCIV